MQYKYKIPEDIKKSEEYLDFLNRYNHATSAYEAHIWLDMMKRFVDEELWECEVYVKGFDEWCKEYAKEESRWHYPYDKMPNIGDRIVVQDWDGKEMEIVFESYPSDVEESNVCKWRYAE